MKAKEIDYGKIELSGDQLRISDPTLEALILEEFNDLLIPLTDFDRKAASVVANIGSWQSQRTGLWSLTRSKFKTVEQSLSELRDMRNTASRYFRLKVEDTVIGTMPSDTWKDERGFKTLGLIREKTEAYLSSEDARALISDAARELVTIRQARGKW